MWRVNEPTTRAGIPIPFSYKKPYNCDPQWIILLYFSLRDGSNLLFCLFCSVTRWGFLEMDKKLDFFRNLLGIFCQLNPFDFKKVSRFPLDSIWGVRYAWMGDVQLHLSGILHCAASASRIRWRWSFSFLSPTGISNSNVGKLGIEKVPRQVLLLLSANWTSQRMPFVWNEKSIGKASFIYRRLLHHEYISPAIFHSLFLLLICKAFNGMCLKIVGVFGKNPYTKVYPKCLRKLPIKLFWQPKRS